MTNDVKNISRRLFITATDTDAGKTLVTSALLYLLGQTHSTTAFKPISAGCDVVGKELVNDDAAKLKHYANSDQSLFSVNPIAFEEPIAPHIAAANFNRTITLSELENHYDKQLPEADYLLTEGAGGWRLPLGKGVFLSEFAVSTQQDIILVVNMKLGCLNHAVLTYQTIRNDGLNVVAWVANCQSEMDYLNENIKELSTLIDAPCLGKVPHVGSIEEAALHLDIKPLLSR